MPNSSGDAAHDVDAAGKIAVELQAVERSAQKDDQTGIGGIVAVKLGDRRGQRVGDEHLFQHTPEHQLDAVAQVFGLKAMLGEELRRKLAVAVDPPCTICGK